MTYPTFEKNKSLAFFEPIHPTSSDTKKAALITVSIQNYGGLCSIPALSGTEPPGPGECTGSYLPYGTYIVSLDTSPVKTATVTINKTSTSVNIP